MVSNSSVHLKSPLPWSFHSMLSSNTTFMLPFETKSLYVRIYILLEHEFVLAPWNPKSKSNVLLQYDCYEGLLKTKPKSDVLSEYNNSSDLLEHEICVYCPLYNMIWGSSTNTIPLGVYDTWSKIFKWSLLEYVNFIPMLSGNIKPPLILLKNHTKIKLPFPPWRLSSVSS